MAKPIYANKDDVERIIESIRKSILGAKTFGNIKIDTTIDREAPNAVLLFSAKAWIKMTELVSVFQTEVQWHGLVKRIDDFAFEIYDIIVPPHTVSATTVVSDDEEYIRWVASLEDDVLDDIKFHGHSHVNMDVSPSGVDMKYRRDLVTQIPAMNADDTSFYIFFIINKKHEWSAELYDIKANTLYENDDMLMVVDLGEDDLDDFIRNAKNVAKEAVKTYPSAKGSYQSKKNSDDYWERGGAFKTSTYGMPYDYDEFMEVYK